MTKEDRLHWEYGKELRISEHRRIALLVSLALNALLIVALVF
jgi:hypothetical protein